MATCDEPQSRKDLPRKANGRGNPPPARLVRGLALLYLHDRPRRDTLLELVHRELDGVSILPSLFLDELLLLGRQLDADCLLVVFHDETHGLGSGGECRRFGSAADGLSEY